MKDCAEGKAFDNFCYKIIEQSNWFDAIDECKSNGGSLITLNSPEKAKFLAGSFANMSLFWLHDLGLFSYASVSWSNRNSSRNTTFENKNYISANISVNVTHDRYGAHNGTLEMNHLMFGNVSGNGSSEKIVHLEGSFLCPVFSKEDVLEMNCSSHLFGVCEIPGERGREVSSG